MEGKKRDSQHARWERAFLGSVGGVGSEGLGLRIGLPRGCGLGLPSHAEQLQKMVGWEKRGDSHWVSRGRGSEGQVARWEAPSATRREGPKGLVANGASVARKILAWMAWSRALGRGVGDEE